ANAAAWKRAGQNPAAHRHRQIFVRRRDANANRPNDAWPAGYDLMPERRQARRLVRRVRRDKVTQGDREFHTLRPALIEKIRHARWADEDDDDVDRTWDRREIGIAGHVEYRLIFW